MIDLATSPTRPAVLPRIGGQPIALAAATLLVLVAAVGSIAAWRIHTGASPETDRFAAFRQLQAKTASVSEQLVEKTKVLETTQQESIDQLQLVQDQLQTMRRLLAAQQADNRRLAEQVTGLTEAIDGLRQSFASAQASESETPSVRRHKSRTRYARTGSRRSKAKS